MATYSRKIIAAVVALVSALIIAAPAQAATPSASYCWETTHGQAGWTYNDHDNEARWFRRHIEASTGIDVAYNSLGGVRNPNGNTTEVIINYYRASGAWVTNRVAVCENVYFGYSGFTYHDYPKYKEPTGWYD